MTLSLMFPMGVLALRASKPQRAVPAVDSAAPSHREAPTTVSAAAAKTAAVPVPVSPGGLDPYRGLGAWIDLYDYVQRTRIDAAVMAADLQRRGVRTVYLQTGRWRTPGDFMDPGAAALIIEEAHARGLRVVGWYLPGFADIERDVNASVAVLNFRTPSGQAFDGFAADIEDNRAVGGQLAAFNAGVAAYSVRLRAAAPPGTILGAIVPDAKNNTRAPGMWAGFPWPEIARQFDVVMPMAYWSVIKRGCAGSLNADAYMREVTSRTQALMGTPKPMHPIGGIADCTTAKEIEEYVNVGTAEKWVGGSVYDVLTTNASPWGERMWEHLRRFNP